MQSKPSLLKQIKTEILTVFNKIYYKVNQLGRVDNIILNPYTK